MKVTKCPHCQKIFFDIGSDICPVCKKNLEELPDFLKDFFGDNNPFSTFFNKDTK